MIMIIFFFNFFIDLFGGISENEAKNQSGTEYHIFVHGTAEGLHLYKENFMFSVSWKGFLNSLYSLFNMHDGIYTREFLYNNLFVFGQYKDRRRLFYKNEWPVLMGSCPGLCLIEHPKSLCNNRETCCFCVSNIAYCYLYLPFINHMEQLFPKKKHVGYIFNWCGDLSEVDRTFAAKVFADEIERLYDADPHACVKVYAHSHGGNVVLYAATLLQKRGLKLDTVVLLATPIGDRTERWARECNNIRLLLNCFSRYDFTQISDLVFNHGFCHRRLPHLPYVRNINLSFYSDNNKEIKISHIMFFYIWAGNWSQSILLYVPELMSYMETVTKQNIRYKIYQKQ